MRSIRAVMLLMVTGLLVSGCTTTPPSVPNSPTAERSFDGLVKMDNTIADAVWVREGTILNTYDKLWIVGAGIQYRPNKVIKSYAVGRNESEFGLTQRQKDRLEEIVTEEFRKDLEGIKSFQLVEEPGPNTLILVGGLMDVVSFVPPEPIGRSDIYLSEVGAATLVLELKDSQTGAVLIRAVDRRAAEQAGGYLRESNSVTNWAEVRRLASSWASRLAKRIEELRQMDLGG